MKNNSKPNIRILPQSPVNLSAIESIAEINIDTPRDPYTVVKEDLLKHKHRTLSPLIFANSKLDKDAMQQGSRCLYILENLLSLVVQAYYKADFAIESICPPMKVEKERQNQTDSRKSHSARHKTIRKQQTNKKKTEGKPKEQESSETTKVNFIDDCNILDYLISPLKADFEFGQLIRELVDQADSAF